MMTFVMKTVFASSFFALSSLINASLNPLFIIISAMENIMNAIPTNPKSSGLRILANNTPIENLII